MIVSFIVLALALGETGDGGAVEDVCRVVDAALSAKVFAKGINREVAPIMLNISDVWPESRVTVVVGTRNVPAACNSNRYRYQYAKPKAGYYLALGVRRVEGMWTVAVQVRSLRRSLMYGEYCVAVDVSKEEYRGEFLETGCDGLLRWW